jgi:hypothetical protein
MFVSSERSKQMTNPAAINLTAKIVVETIDFLAKTYKVSFNEALVAATQTANGKKRFNELMALATKTVREQGV